MFVILEKKGGKLSFCPQKWVKKSDDGKDVVFWPKKNQTTLQQDPESEPVLDGAEKWLYVPDLVKRWNIPSVKEAEHEIDVMINKTDTDLAESEEENIIMRTRQKKCRRKKNDIDHSAIYHWIHSGHAA